MGVELGLRTACDGATRSTTYCADPVGHRPAGLAGFLDEGFGPAGPGLAEREGRGLGLRQARPGGLVLGPAGPSPVGFERCGLGLRPARSGGLGFGPVGP